MADLSTKVRLRNGVQVPILGLGMSVLYIPGPPESMMVCKEYIERRHGEPNNFLFLPKMGLLDSQAGN